MADKKWKFTAFKGSGDDLRPNIVFGCVEAPTIDQALVKIRNANLEPYGIEIDDEAKRALLDDSEPGAMKRLKGKKNDPRIKPIEDGKIVVLDAVRHRRRG